LRGVLLSWDDACERHGFVHLPDFSRSRMVPLYGVGFTTHPRGGRLGNLDLQFPGKRTAVFIDGTVNDNTDRNCGWTVEPVFS